MLSVSVIGFGMSSRLPAEISAITLAGLVLLVGGLIALRHDALFRWAERVVAWIEGRRTVFGALVRELQNAIRQWHVAVSQWWRVVTGVSIGALVHIVNVLTFMVLAVGIGINIGFGRCWIAGLVSIAGLIPITIGQVTAGGALVALLRVQNVSMVDAVALAALVVAVTCLVAVSEVFWNGTACTREARCLRHLPRTEYRIHHDLAPTTASRPPSCADLTMQAPDRTSRPAGDLTREADDRLAYWMLLACLLFAVGQSDSTPLRSIPGWTRAST